MKFEFSIKHTLSRLDKLCLVLLVLCFLAPNLEIMAIEDAAIRAAEDDKPTVEIASTAPQIDCTPLVEAMETAREVARMERYRKDIPLDRELQTALREACEEYGVPECLVVGLIEVESGFDVSAVSSKGCVGLMQTNTKYASTFEENAGYSIYTPFGNIYCGVWYLSSLISRYNGDQLAALTAYNMGTYSGTVSQYARNVMKASEKWGTG